MFVTVATFNDDRDLEDNPSMGSHAAPQVCEVLGHYAAYFIADRSHRLSTSEEIERFRFEQRQREEACAKAEAKNPNNKNVHQTITYNVLPDELRLAANAAAADAPASKRRNVVAGEQEK